MNLTWKWASLVRILVFNCDLMGFCGDLIGFNCDLMEISWCLNGDLMGFSGDFLWDSMLNGDFSWDTGIENPCWLMILLLYQSVFMGKYANIWNTRIFFWWFPEIGVGPLVIIHFGGIFPEIHHRASLGYPHDELEPPLSWMMLDKATGEVAGGCPLTLQPATSGEAPVISCFVKPIN